MVKCTINGIAVEVPAGTTIIEAFKKVDQDIAHYCWHPGLSVAGVCRLCMVEIQGNPRLQIACNTAVTEGMVVTNQSEMVKDAVKWGLDFHLINHPLDCPICDQAGECGLQDQYMRFGQYDSEMGQDKVKKQKVVDLGEKVVLDSERCILCSRCVRFTEEVTKTNELGIFNRGDHSEIGTFAGRPLNNDYSVNTVDICPVGALTSKDFRFRQRVWFLNDKPSICTGCSTGCSVDVYFNPEGVWRVKPRHSEVNGYWMCDHGRNIYKSTNMMITEFVGDRDTKKAVKKQNRLLEAFSQNGSERKYLSTIEQLQELRSSLKGKKIALILTGQQTVEEYETLLEYWTKNFGKDEVYHWKNNPEAWNEFDGLLIRGDKNPNTRGLLSVLEKKSIKAKDNLDNFKDFDWVVVAAPENTWVYQDIHQKAQAFQQAKQVLWLTATSLPAVENMGGSAVFIPLKTFAEKSGTFVNFEGRAQKFEKVDIFNEQALSLSEVARVLDGQPIHLDEFNHVERVQNEFIHLRGQL